MAEWIRRTKIIATTGPASTSPEMIRQLIDAGVNVFRLNFSHSSHEAHGEAIREIRKAASELRQPIAILQDLQGPKIRTGELVNHQPVRLSAGGCVRIAAEGALGTAELISTTYQDLAHDVRPGDTILLDDGRIQLTVRGVKARDVIAEVVVGGVLGERKGMNLPHTPLSAPCLTEKDIADLRFGVSTGVDYIGLSFVEEAGDIERVRREVRAAGADVPIIAKIERAEAISHLEDIVIAADAVMVARGDLGVETSMAEIPLLQKHILAVAGRYGKPDITATQMLETMVANPQPSRAEATDVANAVFDGTDALMLSAETAIGKYPVEAVRTMAEIAVRAERHLAEYGKPTKRPPAGRPATVAEATVHAACMAAAEIGARALAVFTLSGRTAGLVAARRPRVPVLAFTPHEQTYRHLTLAWGVLPVRSELVNSPDALIATADRLLRETGLVREGDLVVILTGSTSVPGTTNIMRIHRAGTR